MAFFPLLTCDMCRCSDNDDKDEWRHFTSRNTFAYTLSIFLTTFQRFRALNKSTWKQEIINMITEQFVFKQSTEKKEQIFRSIFENNYLQFVVERKTFLSKMIRVMESDGEKKVSFCSIFFLFSGFPLFADVPSSYCSAKTTTEASSTAENNTTEQFDWIKLFCIFKSKYFH